MGNGTITNEAAWKLVGGIVTVLLTILIAISGWAWSAQAAAVKEIERRDNSLSDRVSKLEAHYEHIEDTQDEIQQDVRKILEELRNR